MPSLRGKDCQHLPLGLQQLPGDAEGAVFESQNDRSVGIGWVLVSYQLYDGDSKFIAIENKNNKMPPAESIHDFQNSSFSTITFPHHPHPKHALFLLPPAILLFFYTYMCKLHKLHCPPPFISPPYFFLSTPHPLYSFSVFLSSSV